MANLKYKNAWKLINKYNFDIDTELHRDLTCVICRRILQNACQSPCGCRFCYSCLDTYLNGEKKCCPGGLEDCKDQMINLKEDISFDLVANKLISRIQVECPHDFCRFKTELKDIESHLESHGIKCPYSNMGCNNSQMSINDIKDHLNMENYSHTNFLMEFIQNMQNEIDVLKENVNKKEVMITELRNEIAKNKSDMKREIENLRLNKNYKGFHKKDSRGIYKKQIFEKGNNNTCDTIPDKTGSMKWDEVELSEEEENETKETPNSKQSFPRIFRKQNYAPFEWRIENFLKKKNAMKHSYTKYIESETFYTSQRGYKMSLRLYPNGDKEGENTHLSIYFALIHGEYDNDLPWPMMKEITLALIDQKTKQIYTKRSYNYNSTYKTFRCAFYQPALRRNHDNAYFWGTPTFIEFRDLTNLIDTLDKGSILIKCSVE